MDLIDDILKKVEIIIRGDNLRQPVDKVHLTKSAAMLFDWASSPAAKDLSDCSDPSTKETFVAAAIKLHNKGRNLQSSNSSDLKKLLKSSSAWILLNFTKQTINSFCTVVKLLSRASQDLKDSSNLKLQSLKCSQGATNTFSRLSCATLEKSLAPLELQDIKIAAFQSFINTAEQVNSAEHRRASIAGALDIVHSLPYQLKLTFIDCVTGIADRISCSPTLDEAAHYFGICLHLVEDISLLSPSAITIDEINDYPIPDKSTILHAKIKTQLSLSYVFNETNDYERALSCISAIESELPNISTLNLSNPSLEDVKQTVVVARFSILVRACDWDGAVANLRTLVKQSGDHDLALSCMKTFVASCPHVSTNITSELFKTLTTKFPRAPEVNITRISHLRAIIAAVNAAEEDHAEVMSISDMDGRSGRGFPSRDADCSGEEAVTIVKGAGKLVMRKLQSNASCTEIALQLSAEIITDHVEGKNVLDQTLAGELVSLLSDRVQWHCCCSTGSNRHCRFVVLWVDQYLAFSGGFDLCDKNSVGAVGILSLHKVEALLALKKFSDARDVALSVLKFVHSTPSLITAFKALLHAEAPEDAVFKFLLLQRRQEISSTAAAGAGAGSERVVSNAVEASTNGYDATALYQLVLCTQLATECSNLAATSKAQISSLLLQEWLSVFVSSKSWRTCAHEDDCGASYLSVVAELAELYLGTNLVRMEPLASNLSSPEFPEVLPPTSEYEKGIISVNTAVPDAKVEIDLARVIDSPDHSQKRSSSAATEEKDGGISNNQNIKRLKRQSDLPDTDPSRTVSYDLDKVGSTDELILCPEESQRPCQDQDQGQVQNHDRLRQPNDCLVSTPTASSASLQCQQDSPHNKQGQLSFRSLSVDTTYGFFSDGQNASHVDTQGAPVGASIVSTEHQASVALLSLRNSPRESPSSHEQPSRTLDGDEVIPQDTSKVSSSASCIHSESHAAAKLGTAAAELETTAATASAVNPIAGRRPSALPSHEIATDKNGVSTIGKVSPSSNQSVNPSVALNSIGKIFGYPQVISDLPPGAKPKFLFSCSLGALRRNVLSRSHGVVALLKQVDSDGCELTSLGAYDDLEWLADLCWNLGTMLTPLAATSFTEAAGAARPTLISNPAREQPEQPTRSENVYSACRLFTAAEFFESAVHMYAVIPYEDTSIRTLNQCVCLLLASGARLDADTFLRNAVREGRESLETTHSVGYEDGSASAALLGGGLGDTHEGAPISIVTKCAEVGIFFGANSVKMNLEKSRENAMDAKKVLTEYLHSNDRTESFTDKGVMFRKVAFVYEYTVACRLGANEATSFWGNRKEDFLALSAAQLLQCFYIAQKEPGGTTELLRAMLNFSLQVCNREIPTDYSLMGSLFLRLIELSPSRSAALERIEEFEQLASSSGRSSSSWETSLPSERPDTTTSFINEDYNDLSGHCRNGPGSQFDIQDIDRITSTAFNYGVTLSELGQADLAEKFISRALILLRIASPTIVASTARMQMAYEKVLMQKSHLAQGRQHASPRVQPSFEDDDGNSDPKKKSVGNRYVSQQKGAAFTNPTAAVPRTSQNESRTLDSPSAVGTGHSLWGSVESRSEIDKVGQCPDETKVSALALFDHNGRHSKDATLTTYSVQ